MPNATDVVEAAEYYLDRGTGLVRDDCSGLVESVMLRAGVDTGLTGSVVGMWQDADERGMVVSDPVPGDLAFFDDTWDRDGDKRVDDPLTHVAVVVSVDDSGLVTMVHKGTISGISILTADMADPHDKDRNTPIATPGWGGPEGRLTGELMHGFVRVVDDPGIAVLEKPARGPKRVATVDPPTVAVDGPAMVAARDGVRIRGRDLRALGCDEMRAVRGAVFEKYEGDEVLLVGWDEINVDRLDWRIESRCEARRDVETTDSKRQ